MKKLLTAIAMSIALFQPITAMAATATEASVKELLQVTKSEQMLDQVSAQMDSIMSQSIQQVQKQQGEPLTDALGHVVHGDIGATSHVVVKSNGLALQAGQARGWGHLEINSVRRRGHDLQFHSVSPFH